MSRTATTLGPSITFDCALRSRFVFGGRTYQVASCPVEVLQQLVRDSLPKEPLMQRDRKSLALLALLKLLADDAGDTERWYTVETLLNQKVLKRSYFVDGQD